jgi:hypothetical protein
MYNCPGKQANKLKDRWNNSDLESIDNLMSDPFAKARRLVHRLVPGEFNITFLDALDPAEGYIRPGPSETKY